MSTTSSSSFNINGLVVQQTTVRQTRDAAIISGSPVYRVAMSVLNRGQLPDYGVFLVQISSASDVSQDAFARVASVPDLVNYPNDRGAALTKSLSYYRTSSWTATFTDLNTANTTAQVYRDNINTLSSDYLNFSLGFQTVAPGQTYTFPSGDTSALGELVNAYISAAAGVTQAQNDAALATATLTAAQTSYASALATQSQLTDVNTALGKITPEVAAFNNLITAVAVAEGQVGTEPSPFANSVGNGTKFFGALNDLCATLAANPPTVSVSSPENTKLTNIQNGYNTFLSGNGLPLLETAYNSLFNVALVSARAAYLSSADLSSKVSTAVASATAAVAVASAAVSAAQKSSVDANNSLTLAQSALQSAISATQAACPDFDPANPTSILS